MRVGVLMVVGARERERAPKRERTRGKQRERERERESVCTSMGVMMFKG